MCAATAGSNISVAPVRESRATKCAIPPGPTTGARVTEAESDIWTVMATARTIRRFTDEPVEDAALTRCLRAATWAPNGANAQEWRFVVLRSSAPRAVVAEAAAQALAVIEPV